MAKFNLEIGEASNDLVLTEGKNLSVLGSPSYYAQKIKSKLKLFYGEWFLNFDIGAMQYKLSF